MTSRVVGVDLAAPVTEELVTNATRALQQRPAFWGRYFTSVKTTGTIEYRHEIENPILHANNIRVLPIARQTNRVGGTESDGENDGVANGHDIVASFGEEYLEGQGGRFFLFLDVEGSGTSRLSSEYYKGWTEGLKRASAKVEILPCVYGIPGDTHTWSSLARSISGGTTCHALWLSHPVIGTEPIFWNAKKSQPLGAVVDAPVLLWQYMFPRAGLGCDRNLCNPKFDATEQVLSRLILPPSTTN